MLTHEEAITVLDQLFGTYELVAKILYGSKLRISEALQLSVKDLDFAHQQIVARDGTGGNSEITGLSFGSKTICTKISYCINRI